MAIERSPGTYGRYLVLSALVAAFIVTVSAEGYCTDFGLPIHHINLPPMITISPNLAYTGQTITITGSGFNATPYPGDTYPTIYCNAYCDEHGTVLPIKIQSDGSFVIQPTPNAAGTADIYAWDKWGNQSNKVTLTVTEPVTFKVTIVDGKNAPYSTNGVFCLKYPASGSSHYENSIIGSSYTTKMAYNGTSAEVWIRQAPLTTDHKTIQNIMAGQTYTVTLTMPINTPTPTPTIQPGTQTPTPTQNPQVTANPTGMPSTQPGAPDTVAPITTLNMTGIKDTSGTFTSNVICTLTAIDNDGGSGVNNTTYSFDGNSWTTYTSPFTISTPGNKTVFYRSVDLAGNQEVAKVGSFAIASSANTATAQGMSCLPALLLPLLSVGVAGLYGMRKWQQK